MKDNSRLQRATMIAFVMGFIIFGTELALAQPTTTGTWTLFPPQETIYTTMVQEPINADGTSDFKFTGKSVIPIKFKLSTSPRPVIFQSIGSDGSDSNDYSYLSFTPDQLLPFNLLTTLSALYNFIEGNCHGGALRWSVRIDLNENGQIDSEDGSIFIYYGGLPNFTDCVTGGVNQSGTDMIGLSDLRYDLTQVGGTFYDSYANALILVGNKSVLRASLVLDGGWAGDQVINPVSDVTVNDNTFVPLSGSAETCNLPLAEIKITQLSGNTLGPINDPLSIQPRDDNSQFRIVDCKYMYNLATSSLYGPGRYKVEAVINGTPAGDAAEFDLR